MSETRQSIVLHPLVLRQCLRKFLLNVGKISGWSFSELRNHDDKTSLDATFNDQAENLEALKNIAMILTVAKLQKIWAPVMKSRNQAVKFLGCMIDALEQNEQERERLLIMEYFTAPSQPVQTEEVIPPKLTVRDRIAELSRYTVMAHDVPIEGLSDMQLEHYWMQSHQLIKDITSVLVQRVSPDPEAVILFSMGDAKEAEQIMAFVPEVKTEILRHLRYIPQPGVILDNQPARMIA